MFLHLELPAKGKVCLKISKRIFQAQAYSIGHFQSIKPAVLLN